MFLPLPLRRRIPAEAAHEDQCHGKTQQFRAEGGEPDAAAAPERRQQEQRRHEKNLRLGKRKPWVAPTKDGKALSGAEARLAAQKPGEKHPGRPKVPKKGPGDRDKA